MAPDDILLLQAVAQRNRNIYRAERDWTRDIHLQQATLSPRRRFKLARIILRRQDDIDPAIVLRAQAIVAAGRPPPRGPR
jgi:hypothetical protein